MCETTVLVATRGVRLLLLNGLLAPKNAPGVQTQHPASKPWPDADPPFLVAATPSAAGILADVWVRLVHRLRRHLHTVEPPTRTVSVC